MCVNGSPFSPGLVLTYLINKLEGVGRELYVFRQINSCIQL